MNGTLLNAKIQRGYAISAGKLGTLFDVYRSASGIDHPIQPSNKIATLPVSFSIKTKYNQAPQYTTNMWTMLIDQTVAKAGDVLNNGTDTYVIVSEVPLLPPLALNTSNLVKIERPNGVSGVGNVGYETPQLTTIATYVPAFISAKKETGNQPVGLPGSISKRVYWEISIYAPNGTIRDRDIITDDYGYRYQVVANDWNSPLGYLLLAERMES